MGLCEFGEHFLVDRLRKAHVDQRTGLSERLQFLSDMLRRTHHAAECKQGCLLLPKNKLCLAEAYRFPELLQSAIGLAARIAYRNRAAVGKRKAKLFLKFKTILRREYGHIRNTAEIREVKDSLVGLSVRPDQSRAVNRKDHRQVLNTDIVQHLVKAAL